jgi:hypothetical protein
MGNPVCMAEAHENDAQLLALDDLAERWRCSRSTAARICRENAIHALRFSKKRRSMVRFRLVDIRNLEAACGN